MPSPQRFISIFMYSLHNGNQLEQKHLDLGIKHQWQNTIAQNSNTQISPQISKPETQKSVAFHSLAFGGGIQTTYLLVPILVNFNAASQPVGLKDGETVEVRTNTGITKVLPGVKLFSHSMNWYTR